ncbi:hypothetical protein Enr13x_16790 [Stieleria neptunia]|uniref:DUF1549 domain-containing protein n=1 Tax=Stieleria neptunia TaxID=2527979 RepID=A0A518HLW5_9BACT|nr:hypothetical protein [Stieleria neptunia]QDV41836.1 hypothetical protein Enr13x_16790 [Stieleria neptunia]
MTQSASQLPHDARSDADPLIDALLAEFVSSDASKRKQPPDLSASILAQLAAPGYGQPRDADDDADPVIDTLLAEFLPADAKQRLGPPDLSATILQRLADSADSKRNEFAEDADPVVDTLLTEFVPVNPVKRKSPPNLVAPILAQSPVTPTSVAAEPSSPSTPPIKASGGGLSMGRLVSILIAVAACILAVVYLSGPDEFQNDPADQSLIVAEKVPDQPSSSERSESPSSQSPQVASSETVDIADGLPDGGSDLPRGIPLDSPRIASSEDQATDGQPDPVPSAPSAGQSPAVTLVAAETAATVRDYWQTLGITPTPDAAPAEVVARLNRRLGITLSDQALRDPQQLRDLLAQSANAEQISKRWLALTTGSGIAVMDRPENAGLVSELSKSVSGQAKLDVTLVSLIDGSNQQSGQWYQAIGRRGSEGIATHLAGISINADMRCVRCHDSHIGRSGTQDDYWSFVALVRNVVRRQDNRWVVAAQPATPKPTFYELLDGRQRMAMPKVSKYLLQSTDQMQDFQAWTKTLVGSDVLAGSMVDSLWQLVHGRTLKPSPVDAFAPPVDGNLDRLHRQLADDLKANGFDVARTLALIIASPMARRSVPEVLQGDAMLTSSEQERKEALELVQAFAAAVQTPASSLNQRVEVAMRRVGGRFTPDDQGAILAQPIDGRPRSPKSLAELDAGNSATSFLQQLSVDFPGDEAPLPVSWLRSIDDFDLQVQHLVYLSGRNRVTAEITAAANRLKEESKSRESALSRIWWILRNE